MKAQDSASASAVNTSDAYTTIKKCMYECIDNLNMEFWELNNMIHSNPELNFEEFKAHDNITAFLLSKGIEVTTHAFGLSTSFLAEYGTGGRVVTFCAEYDALPDIGHACGHNLIATSSIAAFFGVVEALRTSHVAGRVRLLGTPAEEGGGGKIKLIDAGAFKGTDAALMIHPTTPQANGDSGVAYGTCLASMGTTAVFRGQGTHAGSTPWLGVNALDAAVLSYSAIGMLRQQIRPDDRINLIIKAKEDSRVNIIAESSAVDCNIRCPTFAEVRALKEKVMRCFSGAAIATGCSVELTDSDTPYSELRPSKALCTEFARVMDEFGEHFTCDLANIARGSWGTDMGNVSHVCPSFHGSFALLTLPGEVPHSAGFTRAAGTDDAHKRALGVGKGMAATGWRVLVDDTMAKQMWLDFEKTEA